jgi:hypothetical protein
VQLTAKRAVPLQVQVEVKQALAVVNQALVAATTMSLMLSTRRNKSEA